MSTVPPPTTAPSTATPATAASPSAIPATALPLTASRPRRPVVAIALLVVLALHVLAGLAMGGPLLADAVRDGWTGAFTGDRETIFWFLLTGLGLLPALPLLARLERQDQLPRSFGLILLGTGLVGASAMPLSGFWLVLAVGVLALLRARPRGGRG